MQKGFIIAAFVFLLACNQKETEKKLDTETKTQVTGNTVVLTPEQFANAGIVTGKPELKTISSILRVNGEIDVPPQNMVTISVPMGGYLQSTRLLPGMYVKKGQVIALIQDQQYIQMQQDYLTSNARLGYLEKEYQRQRELNQSKATSDKQFQQTESEFKTQQVLAKSFSEKLLLIGINPDHLTANSVSRSINVYSPINGYVSKVNVSIGKYVNPSDILFEIINPADIHLTLNVFEKDINKLSIGQKVLAYSNSEPAKKYNCKIMLINKDVSPDRSAEVHCHFEQYDKNLMPGMFMNAEIELNNIKAYVLPDDAIVKYENKTYVFTTKDKDRFELTPIQTGITQNGTTEIINNIVTDFENKIFVTKGAYALLMKMKNTSDEE
jgi:cobalt-zinc-cadmium efflux system membrane fusion protein